MIDTTTTTPATADGPTMRLQLALNVSNLDDAVDFYTRMFATEPRKRRPGYANFAIANPPLKLVLFETGEDGTINHLGVETSTTDEVLQAEARLSASGLETTGVADTECCFAEKTETWLSGPDETRWEWYVRTGDTESFDNVVLRNHVEGAANPCCAPDDASTPAAQSDDTPSDGAQSDVASAKPCC